MVQQRHKGDAILAFSNDAGSADTTWEMDQAAVVSTRRLDADQASGSTADFDRFFRHAEPRLRRALAGSIRPEQVADAVNEAMLYAWEHRDRVLGMSEPVGFLYRVAQSKSRSRKQGFTPWPDDGVVPDVEPGLPRALSSLPAQQATAVWLVKACGFSQVEAADAMGLSPSTVSTHVDRGMRRLRLELGVAK